jgi:hypothetical protein
MPNPARRRSAMGPILLKNSPPKFGHQYFGHEKVITLECLPATSLSRTLVVKQFLENGDFLSAKPSERVFQQNRTESRLRTKVTQIEIEIAKKLQ